MDTPSCNPGLPRTPSLGVKLFWTVLFGLMGIAWIIYLGGVAASQQACVDNLNSVKTANSLPNFPGVGRKLMGQEEGGSLEVLGGRRLLAEHGRHLLASSSEACSQSYSFTWWTVWFDVVCIGLAIVSALLGGAHQNTSIIFMTIETAILMVVASGLNANIFANKDSNVSSVKDIVAANRAAMAGNVMLMILNLLYLVCATESTGVFTPVLGAVSLPAMPKLGGSGADAAKTADMAPPVSATTGALPPAAHAAAGAPAEPTTPAAEAPAPEAHPEVPKDADGPPPTRQA